MLTKEEALIVIQSLEKWPGGMGCILTPSTKSKRGYKSVDWGWRGHVPGNFDYTLVSSFGDDALLCPVTAVGVSRNAKGFKDHQKAYEDIRDAVIETMGCSQEHAQDLYNLLLKTDPLSLAQVFFDYYSLKDEDII